MRRAVLVALLASLARAESVDEVLVRARHAQLVQGDLAAAIALYREALRDKSLEPARQAAVHLRLAACYHDSGRPEEAKGHLAMGIYEREGVPATVRLRAAALRERIKKSEPKRVERQPPPKEDPEAQRLERLRNAKQRARLFLRGGDLAQASYHVEAALELAPDDAEVRALAAELETRLSGVMDFLAAPLGFVSRWTASRTRAVAKEAESLLRRALIHASKGEITLAERYFGEAIGVIDACEFAADSDELDALRVRVHERWRSMRKRHFGEARADPVPRKRARRDTLVSDYLNHLQRMLDLVSSREREYRIVPVAARRPSKEKRGRVVPRRFALFDHLPSQWTPALFASLYLPLRVHPDSWHEKGNYLEAAGGLLITRNRPEALDSLQAAVKRIESPEIETIDVRFLYVSLPRAALAEFAKHFGGMRVSERGDSPLRYAIVPPRYSLDYILSYLRDTGADIKLDRDTFAVTVENGVAQTLFAGVPIASAKGYEGFQPRGAPVSVTHYGMHLDTFPLRERDGRTALAMRVAARFPAPAIDGSPARFLSQEGELFADIPAGATLAVGGILDPFAAGARGEQRELLLLWENPRAKATPREDTDGDGRGVEIPLRHLLLEVRDHPGPRADKERGFVRRDRLDVRLERAEFLQALMREGLSDDTITVDAEEAVARVPAVMRDRATAFLAQLERESARSYVVRVHTRAVRTRVFERWMRREELKLVPFGSASLSMREDTSPEMLLRGLLQVEADDVFAPATPWPAITVLGLQTGHALHARTRTSPQYATDDDLAKGDTRTIAEGTRVSVKPYAWGNRLRVWVDIEIVGLQSEVEELSLSRAVPSYKTAVSGSRVAGFIDFGEAARPGTALICRIPHPTASTAETITEIVIALTVRAIQ